MMNAHHVRLLSKITILAGAAMLILALSSLAQAQQRFNTPQEAVDALINAARSGDRKTVAYRPRPWLAGARLLRRPGGRCQHAKGIPGEL